MSPLTFTSWITMKDGGSSKILLLASGAKGTVVVEGVVVDVEGGVIDAKGAVVVVGSMVMGFSTGFSTGCLG
jgi:hypothetical protein